MEFTALNDNGPNETLFTALDGYNVRITYKPGEDQDVVTNEFQVLGCGGAGVELRLFVGEEDEPSGEVVFVNYDDIVEVAVH